MADDPLQHVSEREVGDQAILLGAITGIGGGMLRDVLLRDVPTVLRQDLYAIPALLGAGVLVVAQEAGSTSPVGDRT